MSASFTAKLRFAFASAVFSLGAVGAKACSVCVVANDEARSAYYSTTALLSLLPLALVGGVVFYVVKKSRSL